MRIWHDDVRAAPESGWEWVRTNDEAIKYLQHKGLVEEISLDHDLGHHNLELPQDPDELAEVMYKAGQSEQTGMDLVTWMIEHDRVPAKIRIHSWNPSGAKLMSETLRRHGYECVVKPFDEQEMEAVLRQPRFYVRYAPGKETDGRAV